MTSVKTLSAKCFIVVYRKLRSHYHLLVFSISTVLLLGCFVFPYLLASPPEPVVPLSGEWKISLEDSPEFSSPGYNDRSWNSIHLPGSIVNYSVKEADRLNGICWIRKKVFIQEKQDLEPLGLVLGRIGNADEVYFNGVKIGGLGGFPPDEYLMWNHPRNYEIPKQLIRFGGENVISVRISYFGIGEVLGRLMIISISDWKQYSVAVEFTQIHMGYVTIAMGLALFMIFSFFFLKRLDSQEYFFYCLQLAFGLPIVLEVCNYWHIYPNPLFRFKVLALSWVGLNVAHPIFLHRIYALERPIVERVLWVYLVLILFMSVFFTPLNLIRQNGILVIIITTGIGFYNFSCHITALIRKSPYSKMFSFFGITVVLCAIHDGFVYLSKFSGWTISFFGYKPDIMIFHVGAIILYMGTSLVLVSRFIDMTDEVETLNADLENFIIENALLNKKLKETTEKKASVSISSEAEEKIKQVMNYIHDNYLNEITREELADSVGVHPDSLGKQFKRYTGKKLGDYIYELRITEAARMLRDGDANIIDIAFNVGFESVRTFNRIFPKFMDCTPNAYRQKYRDTELQDSGN